MARRNKNIIWLIAVVPTLLIAFFGMNRSDEVSNIPKLIDKNDQISDQVQEKKVAPSTSLVPQIPKILMDAAQTTKQPIGQTDNLNQILSPIEQIRALQNKTAMHESILKDHDAYNRYPSFNAKVSSAASDPLMQRYNIDERTTLNDEKTAALTLWSSQPVYQRGESVTVYAKLIDSFGIPLDSKFVAQLVYEGRENITSFDLADANKDGTHEFSFMADEILGKTLTSGVYKILVVNNSNNLMDSVTFVLSDPNVRLTGEYRDSLDSNRNLLIEAEVEVSKADRFYLQASLYTELGDAIGVTQQSLALKKGRHWVPLEYFGLMVRDSGVDGPYRLKNISIARVTMPLQRGPLTHPNYFTEAYQLTQFSNQAYSEVLGL